MSAKEQAEMVRTVEELKSDLSRLSAQDRAELAHFLILSLEEGADADAEAAWDAELERRAAEIESGQVVGEPASKVFAELRDKYPVKPLRFHPQARAELDDAMAYYEGQRDGLGIEFLQQIELSTAQIQRDPGVGAPYKDFAHRHYVVRRFPFVIYYREREDAIWIMAVAHGSRRPDYWANRRVE